MVPTILKSGVAAGLLFISSLMILTPTILAMPASTASGAFNNTGNMNVPRVDHTATLLPNSHVLVAGGFNGRDGYLASAELYNPVTGRWTLTGSMNVPRDLPQAVLLRNGQVLVAGGLNLSGGFQSLPLASAELYNPATGTWTPTGNMTTGRYSFTLTLLSNGQVLAAGGTNNGNGGLTSAELYNPATGTWTATGSMATGNQSTGAVLLPNGEVFVVATAELYNPTTAAWSTTTPSPSRGGAPIVLLPHGQVWVGMGNQLFNSATAQWTTFAPPPCTTGSQHCGSAAAFLNTGKVLVAGGITFVNGNPYPTEETIKSAALWDPSTMSWASTGSLNTSRTSESMTLLPDGRVLVAGGMTFEKRSGKLVATASAELYTP